MAYVAASRYTLRLLNFAFRLIQAEGTAYVGIGLGTAAVDSCALAVPASSRKHIFYDHIWPNDPWADSFASSCLFAGHTTISIGIAKTAGPIGNNVLLAALYPFFSFLVSFLLLFSWLTLGVGIGLWSFFSDHTAILNVTIIFVGCFLVYGKSLETRLDYRMVARVFDSQAMDLVEARATTERLGEQLERTERSKKKKKKTKILSPNRRFMETWEMRGDKTLPLVHWRLVRLLRRTGDSNRDHGRERVGMAGRVHFGGLQITSGELKLSHSLYSINTLTSFPIS